MDKYDKLTRYFNDFKGEKEIIGKSEDGRNIYAFFVGEKKKPTVLLQYSIHAREHITTSLALRQIDNCKNKNIQGVGIYFLPLVNPDGVVIAQGGIDKITEGKKKLLNRVNKGKKDFSLIKCNANCVDLNQNFNARFGTGKKNVFYPATENYVGKHPFSESESRALRDITYKVKPVVTVSYHSKGEVIYFDFYQDKIRYERDKKLCEKLSKSTGYKIEKSGLSAGGYKDWCISLLKIPAFTIEVGNDKLSHPIKENELSRIYKQNSGVIDVLIDYAKGQNIK